MNRQHELDNMPIGQHELRRPEQLDSKKTAVEDLAVKEPIEQDLAVEEPNAVGLAAIVLSAKPEKDNEDTASVESDGKHTTATRSPTISSPSNPISEQFRWTLYQEQRESQLIHNQFDNGQSGGNYQDQRGDQFGHSEEHRDHQYGGGIQDYSDKNQDRSNFYSDRQGKLLDGNQLNNGQGGGKYQNPRGDQFVGQNYGQNNSDAYQNRSNFYSNRPENRSAGQLRHFDRNERNSGGYENQSNHYYERNGGSFLNTQKTNYWQQGDQNGYEYNGKSFQNTQETNYGQQGDQNGYGNYGGGMHDAREANYGQQGVQNGYGYNGGWVQNTQGPIYGQQGDQNGYGYNGASFQNTQKPNYAIPQNQSNGNYEGGFQITQQPNRQEYHNIQYDSIGYQNQKNQYHDGYVYSRHGIPANSELRGWTAPIEEDPELSDGNSRTSEERNCRCRMPFGSKTYPRYKRSSSREQPEYYLDNENDKFHYRYFFYYKTSLYIEETENRYMHYDPTLFAKGRDVHRRPFEQNFVSCKPGKQDSFDVSKHLNGAILTNPVPLGELLTVPVKKIVLNAPFEFKKITHFELINHSNRRIAFGIKTNKMRLKVEPSCEVLGSNEAVMIALSCDAFPMGEVETCDYILVEWMNTPFGDEKEFNREWFKGEGVFRRLNLPVFYNER